VSPGYDAVVVGAGPNGLVAAITIAEQGFSVHVVEAAEEPGGAARTAELTLPGFRHDVGATVLPLGVISPFFRGFDAHRYGLEMVHPGAPLAHPLDGADAVMLERSIDDTAAGLGRDARRYARLLIPLARNARPLLDQFLGPVRPPRHPLLVGAFAVPALLPAAAFSRVAFRESRARALFAGLAAHSTASLTSPATASVGLVMAMTGHAAGWPVVRGGTANLIAALTARLAGLGGTIETGHRVASLEELPAARVRVLDLVPRDVERVCGDALPARYRRRLGRYRHGPGAFKLDWALAGPVPWADPRCARAATVHLGGGLDEIAASEAAVAAGRHPDRPFVILVQPSLIDPSRAPRGRHTAWAYCHVPNGSRVDMASRIEDQVERFAPGFRDLVAARHAMTTADLEALDANLVGGDVNGGAFGPTQVLLRPSWRFPPYSTPSPGIVICSAATPPGGGLHGMCGWWGARSALRTLRAPRSR
jgi:phytoene dehydrogenase-like protein